jgi:hypothetical protein
MNVTARRGAANVDSRCTGTTMRDYLRASDLERLPEEVMKMYDDGTEVQSKILYFSDGESATRIGLVNRQLESSG